MTKHWLPALLLLAGCANLPAIDAGVCGNGILEPGEDCDSSDPSCRACRIDCSPDQNGERRACPDGWACGSDAICRQASGDFVAHPATSESGLLGTAADFDGDGLSDVVTLEPGGVSVHYFDTSGSQASSANIAGTPSWPAVGSLTDDGRASLTLTRGDISVLRGKADRTLSPIAYAPFPVQEGLEGYVIMNAMPGLDYLGDEVLGILRTGDSESVWDVVGNQKLFNLPPSAEPAFLPIRAADLDPASPCDELVMAVNAASTVDVYETCRSVAAGQWEWNKNAVPAAKISLPLGFTVASSTLLAKVNSDEKLDIVVRGLKNKVAGLFVSYGALGASFDSDPANADVVGNDKFAPLSVWGATAELPLAVGDLNGDKKIDLVLPKTVLVSASASVYCGALGVAIPGYECVAYNDGDPWSEAAIADFNANGIVDVIALRKKARHVDFLNGNGKDPGGFNRVELPVDGTATDLAVGDFDGDLLPDAVFKVAGSAANPEDTLALVYGKPLAIPDAPTSVARLQHIQQLAVGNVAPFTGGLFDGVNDIGVLSQSLDGKSQSSAIFFGRADRQLQSSFTLFANNAPVSATRAFVGSFDDDPHPDLALVTSPVGDTDPSQNLVLLPSTGEAALQQSMASATPFPSTFEACGALATVVDLDSDGTDEIVFFGLRYDDGATDPSGLAIARSVAGASGRTFEISPVASQSVGLVDLWVLGAQCYLGADPGSAGSGPGGDDFLAPGAIQAVDFDGDGKFPDVMVLGLVPDADADLEPRLVLYKNEGGVLAESPVIFDDPLVDGAPLVAFSFAIANLDRDPEPEVAVTSVDGRVFVMDMDRDAGQLSEPKLVADVGGALSLRAGDFDGDGVADLVSSGPAGLSLLSGVPVLK